MKFSKYGFQYLPDNKNENITSQCLGFIPAAFVILGWINVYHEPCNYCARLDNFIQILKFLFFQVLLFCYTAAWSEAVASIGTEDYHRHVGYLKAFASLCVIQLLFIICVRPSEVIDIKEFETCSPHHGSCNYFRNENEDEIFCEESGGWDVLNIFAFQVATINITSIICVMLVMCYTWYYLNEDNNDNFENRVYNTMLGHILIEMLFAFYVFDKISGDCYESKGQRYMLLGMCVLNIYGVIVIRGFNISLVLYHKYKELTDTLEQLKTLDDDELEEFDEPICAICDDDIEEDARLADCGHLYHVFCIKEWITEYGDICPECNARLRNSTSQLKIVDRNEEEIDPSLHPEMLMKIVEEMSKFDNKTSFWTEAMDIEPDAGNDDEEEDSDYD